METIVAVLLRAWPVQVAGVAVGVPPARAKVDGAVTTRGGVVVAVERGERRTFGRAAADRFGEAVAGRARVRARLQRVVAALGLQPKPRVVGRRLRAVVAYQFDLQLVVAVGRQTRHVLVAQPKLAVRIHVAEAGFVVVPRAVELLAFGVRPLLNDQPIGVAQEALAHAREGDESEGRFIGRP